MIKVDLNIFRNSEFKVINQSEVRDFDNYDYPEICGETILLDPELGPSIEICWSIKGQYRDQNDYSGEFHQQEALADGFFNYEDIQINPGVCANDSLYDTGFGDSMDLAETMEDFFLRSEKVKEMIIRLIKSRGYQIC